MKQMDTKDLAIVLVTFFLPPLGVALKKGFGGHFFLNLALTFLGFYLPGLIHGLYVVLKD